MNEKHDSTPTPTASTQAPPLARSEDGVYRVIETAAGQRLLPTSLAGGPWDQDHQHGGAVAGILTRALHRIESPVPMRLVRITVEMFRGVPLRPLRIETRKVRAGRRIQSVEADLFDGDRHVARASGLRIRTDESLAGLAVGDEHVADLGPPPAEENDRLHRPEFFEHVPGFLRAVEIRLDRPPETGLAAHAWARLRCAFVENEPTPPIVQLAALADFASGTGNVLDYTRYSAINPDLGIHVLREPRSPWIGVRATTWRAADGAGLSAAELFDLEGPIGRAEASLLLDRR